MKSLLHCCDIYEIRNMITGTRYIGSSVRLGGASTTTSTCCGAGSITASARSARMKARWADPAERERILASKRKKASA